MDATKARARADSLQRSGALDSAAAVGLDKLARLARFVAGARYAAVHLLDDTSQYRVAQAGGLTLAKQPVQESMCLPVVESERALYVPDATQEPLFSANPHISGLTPTRFFAAAPVRDDGGVTIGTLCVFDDERIELDPERLGLLQDIAGHVSDHLQLHSRVRQLGHVATHDPLTGLPNRMLLSERLARAMARRKRHPGETVLAVVDLDGFKAVNDGFGHQVGDELLVQVGQRLEAAVREEDTVARLGGDEFVILYDELPLEGADALVESLRRRLVNALHEPVFVAGRSFELTASIGFVRSRGDELGYELLARADEAMYDQKLLRRRTDGPSSG